MRFGRWNELMSGPQARGFMWGVGAAMAASFLVPAVRKAVFPAPRAVTRGSVVAGERYAHALANAREGVVDVVDEGQ